MHAKALGSQGLRVSPLGLGCMGLTFGYGPVDRARAVATVERALELGVTFFDTSDHFRRVSPRFKGENLHRNRQLVEPILTIARERGATPAQVALAWILASVPEAVPIPGTTRPGRVEENVGSLDVTLTDSDKRTLDQSFPAGAAAGTRWPSAMMALLEG
ncbi:aldo/keto reductase [Nonomuraea helvata]|uniref:Aldo/keto reductase n=1 Tax=Nonomuraea helvata TaxID=37484 RepID=A0ABV5RXI1_9ACTN